jgi:hypothetical protein
MKPTDLLRNIESSVCVREGDVDIEMASHFSLHMPKPRTRTGAYRENPQFFAL